MAAINTKSATFTVDGVEYHTQVLSFVISSSKASSSQVTFAEAAAGGGIDYTVEIDMLQDASTVTGTGAQPLFDLLWSSVGDDVPILYRPYGDVAVSLAHPRYTTTATVSLPEGTLIGGDADAGTDRNTVSVKWSCTKPVKITA